MKQFLEEWGATILVAVAVMALVAIVLGFRGTISSAFSDAIANFTNMQSSALAPI